MLQNLPSCNQVTKKNDLIPNSNVFLQEILTILGVEVSTRDQRNQEKKNPNFHDLIFRKCTSSTSKISKTAKTTLMSKTLSWAFIYAFTNVGKGFKMYHGYL